MTIFTRYMIGRFLKPFAFGLCLFAVLIFLGDTFDKMNYIVKSKASFGIILECLWLGVPYWTIRVIPMATLLATLAHEMCYLRQEMIGDRGHHTAAFRRMAARVCRAHGFDIKTF